MDVHRRNLYLLPVARLYSWRGVAASGNSHGKQRKWVSSGTKPVRDRR